MASSIKIKVNGLTHGVTASLDTPLLYVLHNELHLHGPRFGCGLAQCGACSVLLDGKEIRSCVTPVAAVSGKNITTLEGLPALWAAQRGTSAAAPALHPLAAGVDRRSGAALRLLPERHDDPGCRPARDDEESVRGSDPHGDERAPVPLRDVSADPDRDPEGRGCDGEGRCVMTGLMHEKEFSRKSFVKGGGALIVGFSIAGSALAGKASAAFPAAPATPAGYNPDLNQVDSWITIGADETITLKTSQIETGNGITTGFLQVLAEELDADMSQMRYGMFNTNSHDVVDTWVAGSTGGEGGSNAMSGTGPKIRNVGALARQALLGLASTRLGVPTANLTISKGVISGGGQSVSFGKLVGGKLLKITGANVNLQPGRRTGEAVLGVHHGARRTRTRSSGSTFRTR